jgi:hypothetical protein
MTNSRALLVRFRHGEWHRRRFGEKGLEHGQGFSAGGSQIIAGDAPGQLGFFCKKNYWQKTKNNLSENQE